MLANPRTSWLGLLAAIGGLLLAWAPPAYPWVATVGGLLVALGGGVGLHLAADAPRGTIGTGQPQPNAPAEAPPAPAARSAAVTPVGMTLLALGALSLTACARPLDTAINAANVSRDIGLAAHDAIAGYCVPAYKAAADKAAIVVVDAKCLPAERAYRLYAAAHTTAVLVIQRAALGLATDQDALVAAVAIGRAGADLAAAVKAVSQ